MRLTKAEIKEISRDHDAADYDKRIQVQTLCDMALELLEKEETETDADVDPEALRRTYREMLEQTRKAQKHAEQLAAKLDNLEGALQEGLEELG